MAVHFNQITVIGVGLIGGSFARACRKKGIADKIIGYGRGEENLAKGVELGVIDSYSLNVNDSIKGSDLIFLSPPVESIISLAKILSGCLRPGTIITDAGSVKGEIVRTVGSIFPENVYFVGGHPIAGTEKGGVEASFDTLFKGSLCILTPTAKTQKEALSTTREVWELLGSEVSEMDAAEHDILLGAISHLPHIVSYALVNSVLDLHTEKLDIRKFAAGGFRDITRIASSPSRLWRDICHLNRGEILKLVENFRNSLNEIEECIRVEDYTGLEEHFSRAKGFRDSIG